MRNWLKENWWDLLSYVVILPAMLGALIWGDLPAGVMHFAYAAPAFLLGALLPIIGFLTFEDLLAFRKGDFHEVSEPDSVLRQSSVGVWIVVAAAIGHPTLAGVVGGVYILGQIAAFVAGDYKE